MKRNFLFAIVILSLFLSACSINKMAIKAVSNALTGSGSSAVFSGDTDPRLVGDALPFAIKMYEALLDKNPDHPGLILTTGSLFVMYSNAFVQGPAEMLPLEKFEEKTRELDRAKNLYLRGTAILERGIKNNYPSLPGDWGPADDPDFTAALLKMKKDDVPLFYWFAAGNLSAYALNIFDIGLGLRIPRLVAMMNRAYELDPDFNSGALDEFFLIIYSALPESMGGDPELALMHYERAIEKSKGLSAAPYVAYAQSIAVKSQDYETFKANLEAALEIDPAANPSNALVTVINQEKARFLLDKAEELFADLENWEYDE